MRAVGIICEYNPFHYGHLHHLEEVKRLFPEDVLVLVMTGAFTQRGEASLISKWKRTEIALHYGVDLVVELPFPFAVSSADIFARGAISILKELGVSHLVFGSERNNVACLEKLAKIQLYDLSYQEDIKRLLQEGYNYPTAQSMALEQRTGEKVVQPNDILGLCYIKEIMIQKAPIKAVSIQRTDDYHTSITSATGIRKCLMEGFDIQEYVPPYTYSFYQDFLHFSKDYFPYFKYRVITHMDHLNEFQGMDEGLENRVRKAIFSSHDYTSFMEQVKTKRYTYQRLNRLFTYVLCHFTKEEARKYQEVTYLRILGFSSLGQKYLKLRKKAGTIPIISRYREGIDPVLDLEKRVSYVYMITQTKKDWNQEREEYLRAPIQK